MCLGDTWILRGEYGSRVSFTRTLWYYGEGYQREDLMKLAHILF